MTEDQKSREAVIQAAMYYGVAHTGAGRSSKDPDVLAMRSESRARLQAAVEALEQASRRTYRASVLEEAAKVCDLIDSALMESSKSKFLTDAGRSSNTSASAGAASCASAIRALAVKTQEGQEP